MTEPLDPDRGRDGILPFAILCHWSFWVLSNFIPAVVTGVIERSHTLLRMKSAVNFAALDGICGYNTRK